MTTAVIYSNGNQECERMASLLKALPQVKEFLRYDLDTHFNKQQFQMEFGGDAHYPQVSFGNKHIGNMKETLQFLKNNGMLDKWIEIMYNLREWPPIMNYKPYSIEWNRRRYLSEAIKSYFNDDVEPNIIVDDILDVLAEEIDYYKGRADTLQQVMDGIKND